MIYTDDNGRTYVLKNIVSVSPVVKESGYNGITFSFTIDTADGKTHIINVKEEKIINISHKLLINQLEKMK